MLVARPSGRYICLETRIASIAKIDAPKVENTITFLRSYISEIFPTGNWETAPETAKRNVTIDISSIVKFIDVA